MLSEKTRQAILELQKQYPEKRSALLPALHLAQAEIGYLPRAIQDEVASLFELDPNEVHAVVTFYDMFLEIPTGKHLLHVCKNVSCMLRGSDQLLKGLCQKLDVAPHETTKDGEFTIIPSECLAACDRAPMLLVDEKVVGPVRLEDLDRIIAEAKAGKGHPSPIVASEVVNG
jgi:NADH-quinone oxidoreductase subunit E